MKKIIINACYGGFSLSDAAIKLYAKKKGLTLHIQEKPHNPTYWLIPESEWDSQENWASLSLAEKQASNKFIKDNAISIRDIERDDTTWIAVVEELGGEASGDSAQQRS